MACALKQRRAEKLIKSTKEIKILLSKRYSEKTYKTCIWRKKKVHILSLHIIDWKVDALNIKSKKYYCLKIKKQRIAKYKLLYVRILKK